MVCLMLLGESTAAVVYCYSSNVYIVYIKQQTLLVRIFESQTLEQQR